MSGLDALSEQERQQAWERYEQHPSLPRCGRACHRGGAGARAVRPDRRALGARATVAMGWPDSCALPARIVGSGVSPAT